MTIVQKPLSRHSSFVQSHIQSLHPSLGSSPKQGLSPLRSMMCKRGCSRGTATREGILLPIKFRRRAAGWSLGPLKLRKKGPFQVSTHLRLDQVHHAYYSDFQWHFGMLVHDVMCVAHRHRRNGILASASAQFGQFGCGTC